MTDTLKRVSRPGTRGPGEATPADDRSCVGCHPTGCPASHGIGALRSGCRRSEPGCSGRDGDTENGPSVLSLGRVARYSRPCHRGEHVALPDTTVRLSWLRPPGYVLLAIRLTVVAGYHSSGEDYDCDPVSIRFRREVTLRRVRPVVTPLSLQQVARAAQASQHHPGTEPGTGPVAPTIVTVGGSVVDHHLYQWFRCRHLYQWFRRRRHRRPSIG